MNKESVRSGAGRSRRFTARGLAIVVLAVLVCELPLVIAFVGLGGLSATAVFSSVPGPVSTIGVALGVISFLAIAGVLIRRVFTRKQS